MSEEDFVLPNSDAKSSLALHALLDRLADAVIDYLNAQIDAGALYKFLIVGGGALAHREHLEFSLKTHAKNCFQV